MKFLIRDMKKNSNFDFKYLNMDKKTRLSIKSREFGQHINRKTINFLLRKR